MYRDPGYMDSLVQDVGCLYVSKYQTHLIFISGIGGQPEIFKILYMQYICSTILNGVYKLS